MWSGGVSLSDNPNSEWTRVLMLRMRVLSFSLAADAKSTWPPGPERQ